MPDLELPVEDTREPLPDTGSLSDHEAAYLPKRGEAPVPIPEPAEPVTETEVSARDAALEDSRDPMGRFRPRHRAQSQKARAEDVPRIQELTRKLRDAEERLKAATAPRAEPVAAPVHAPEPSPVYARPAPPTPAPAGEKFTFAKAAEWIEQHPGKDYDDWQDEKMEAWGAWRDQQRETQTAERQQVESRQQRIAAFVQKRDAFKVEHPDYDTAVQAIGNYGPDPELLLATVMAHDNGPALVYYLAQHPVEYHEMRLIAEGKPVSDQHVASLRRLLDARMQAGTTAAVAPLVTHRTPPKPPTAVRTGPLKTGTDAPGDGASLADHEAFYTLKRRS